jgi:uncharacterized protein
MFVDQPVIDARLVVDPARFAREQARAAGTVAPAVLPRLGEVLFDAQGAIEYSVSGFLTPKQQPALRLEIHAEIRLRCQRCLGPLRVAAELRREIVLVDCVDEFGQSTEEEDSVDIIPAVSRLDLGGLIEEEILLGLPMAPRHAEGECRVQALEQTTGPGRAASQEASSPWAALARLKH